MKRALCLLNLILLLTLVFSACALPSETMNGSDEPGTSVSVPESSSPTLSSESTEDASVSEAPSESSSPEEGSTDPEAGVSTEPESSEASPETSTEASSSEVPEEIISTEVPESTTASGAPADTVRMVANVPHTVNPGITFTGKAPLPAIEYAVTDPDNARNLSTQAFSHAYGVAKNGAPHQISVDNQIRFDGYGTGALAWDNRTTDKVLYLTFDCGYEYQNLTSVILDTLAEKEVTAAFFCTLDYLEAAPEITTRMIEEGHTVANHSTTHPSDSSKLTREELAWELLGVDNYLRVNFGYDQCRYFRFPTGTYSENALELVNSLGYKSIFWSLTHADWDPQNQPGVEVSFQTVTSRLHPGAVILLHACSPDNAAILGDFIDYAHEQGYTFRSLDEYPWEQ